MPDIEEGLRRIDGYALPLEDARAQAASPGRITVVLVDEVLGF